MWCETCQADVAAETTADNRFLQCATCGTTLKLSNPDGAEARLHDDRTRDARQLLERWSTSDILDPYGPPVNVKLDAGPNVKLDAGPAERRGDSLSRPVLPPPPKLAPVATDAKTSARIGKELPVNEVPVRETTEPDRAPSEAPMAHHFVSDSPRFDSQHVHGHMHIEPIEVPPMAKPEREPSHWLSWIGQLLAYAGVLGLTLGSCLVLWSQFGGPERYAPTGWLITTASQMLLFLGVITLVSGGLEQVNQGLTRRIDRLGDRLLRFEQAASRTTAGRTRGPLDLSQPDAKTTSSAERVVVNR